MFTEGMVSREPLMTAFGLDMNQEKERKMKEENNGTSEVLTTPEARMTLESMEQEQQMQSGDADENREGMVAYRRNGRTYWRRRPDRMTTETTETETVGRPTLSDEERQSDPYNSVTGRLPKPSNPEGSEAQT